MCINVANEQLQYYFNQHIFAWELEEMKNEGLKSKPINYVDNKALLDMFLQRPMGVLAVLDEESFFPKGTDATFLEKMHKNFKKLKQYYEAPVMANDPHFIINHYAGHVAYNVYGFLEKNRDTLSNFIQSLMLTSKNQLVRLLFKVAVGPTGSMSTVSPAAQGAKTASVLKSLEPTSFKPRRRSSRRLSNPKPTDLKTGPSRIASVRQSRKRRPVSAEIEQAGEAVGAAGRRQLTVSGHFKNSLADLMAKMMAAQPRFVRCIKPNSRQVPSSFNEDLVETQLRYAGVLETVRIRREGYAVRLDFPEFVRRYQVLGFPLTKEIAEVDSTAAVIKILASSGVERLYEEKKKSIGPAWEIGKTKVFLRYFIVDGLNKVLEFYHERATIIEKHVRGWLQRLRYKRELAARAEAERKRKEEEERKAREAAEAEAARQMALQKAEEERRAREEALLQRMKELEQVQANVSASKTSSGTKLNGTGPRLSIGDSAGFAGAGKERRVMKVMPLNVNDFKNLEQNFVGPDRIPPGSESKNRYMNILPNPRSRVRLSMIDDDELSTYINANFIHAFDGTPREYIATQGPKAETVADFWRMVWENKVLAVVMVTGLMEKGVEKCAR